MLPIKSSDSLYSFRRFVHAGLLRLIPKRAAVSLVVMDLIVLFYYVVGNYQLFLPETLFLLLDVMRAVSLALAIVSGAGGLSSFINIPRRRHRWAAFLSYSLALAFALALIAFSSLITVVSNGIS